MRGKAGSGCLGGRILREENVPPGQVTPTWGPKHSAFKAPLEYGKVAYGALVAFKVEEKNGKAQLTPAWNQEIAA